MKNQKGFGVGVVFLLILLIVMAFVGSSVALNQYQKSHPSEVGDRVSGVKTFDECVKHENGIIISKNLGYDEQHISRYVGCQITTADHEQWPATNLDKCSITECGSLTEAFIHYCDNEYRSYYAIPPSQKLKLGYHEDALVSGSYARGSIICHTADEENWFKKKPDAVIMVKESVQWKFLMLISDEQTCKDFDNKGIPPQITSNCYDEELGGQLKKYRIPK